MLKRKNIYFLWAWVYSCAFVSAQDIHFSQFYHSPIAINPAATGIFQGDYRVSSYYKDQWQSITNPYKTMFAACEISFPVKRLGVGLTLMNDKAGKARMGTSQACLSASYNLRIDGSNSLAAGVQYGFAQKSIRLNDLKWDSQYNGAYDPALPSGESNMNDAFYFMDISAGLLYTYFNSEYQFKTTAGAAVLHINQPAQSFWGSEQKLHAKIVGHLNTQIKLADLPFHIMPQLLYTQQGPLRELNMGGMIKYVIGIDNEASLENYSRSSSSAAFLGAQYRYKDALILNAAFELRKALLIGVSYDINVSKLKVASVYRGGMEISLVYKGAFYY